MVHDIKSRSSGKVLNDFQKRIRKDVFVSRAEEIRRVLHIPKNGCRMSDEDRNAVADIFHTPTQLKLAKGKPLKDFLWIVSEQVRELLKEHFPAPNPLIRDAIRCLIFYGDPCLELLQKTRQNQIRGLCAVEDAYEFLSELSTGSDTDGVMTKIYVDSMKRQLKDFPIVIYIHPDASKTDIITFVEENSKLIKFLQSQYENQISKGKLRNAKSSYNLLRLKTADLIYAHRDLHQKEIKRIVKEATGQDLGYEGIGKIKSLEIKRRQGKSD